jgi:type IV fimbrial biogenesis protein FimT
VIGTTRATLSSAMSTHLQKPPLPPVGSLEGGFTLLEMMVVVAIVGIATALAIPNYTVWNARAQVRQATTDLHANLSLARLAAMNQNAAVTMTLTTISGGQYQASFGGAISPVTLPRGVTALVLPIGSSQTVTFGSLGLRMSALGTSVQTITLTNGQNATLIYSIGINTGGKVRWCPSSMCP